MIYVWTWDGTYFGYLDGDNLWTYDGKHVGKLCEKEIFDKDGLYMGELEIGNRLITDLSKKSKSVSRFTPCANRASHLHSENYVAYAMRAGYEDFPHPDR